ncbi:MAG: hypothetical protein ACLTPI_02750 [Bifidobacterium pullorum]
MNDAVYKFRRYEDASLSYTGIEKHEYNARVGLFDTSLSREDYENMKRRDSLLNANGYAIRSESSTPNADAPTPVATKQTSVEPKRASSFSIQKTNAVKTDSAEVSKTAPANATSQPVAEAVSQEDLNKLGRGSIVRHKAFGSGRVVSIAGDKITVNLGGKERVFKFPDAFNNHFLSL